jgi:CMP-N-acetylneuraminic acid synthetase
MKIIAEIPARMGSKRVRNKNIRLLNGKPLIYYSIEACKNSSILKDIYVNSESDEIGKLALKYGVKFYKRNPELAKDKVVSDQFNYDFLINKDCDILVMVNPVSPLITGEDIDKVISFYLNNDFDTVITVREERLQAFCDGKPINFNPNGLLPMTQKVSPIQLCCWSICIWRKEIFIKEFEENGHAVFSGKVGLYPLNPLRAIKISTEEDFQLAETILKTKFDV